MTTQNDVPDGSARAGSTAKEHEFPTTSKIGPAQEEARGPREHPTLAERIAREGTKLNHAARTEPKPAAAPTARPTFVDEPDHVLEPVGPMGKLSPITRAKREAPAVPIQTETGGLPTLLDRVLSEGVSAYGDRSALATKNRRQDKPAKA